MLSRDALNAFVCVTNVLSAAGVGAAGGAMAFGAAAFLLGGGALDFVSFCGVTVICGSVWEGSWPSAELTAACRASAELPKKSIRASGARITLSPNADQHEEQRRLNSEVGRHAVRGGGARAWNGNVLGVRCVTATTTVGISRTNATGSTWAGLSGKIRVDAT